MSFGQNPAARVRVECHEQGSTGQLRASVFERARALAPWQVLLSNPLKEQIAER